MRFLPKIQKPVSTTRQRRAGRHGGFVDLADVPVGRFDVEPGAGRACGGTYDLGAERVDVHRVLPSSAIVEGIPERPSRDRERHAVDIVEDARPARTTQASGGVPIDAMAD